MKKSLLLIALLVISVSSFAAAPNFVDIPDVKLAIGQGLSAAFDLACFNTTDAATGYNVVSAFQGLSNLSGSVVNQDPYGSATVGDNTYSATNEGGTGTASNKVKWSTYRIDPLPIVGLSVGKSITIDLANYVHPSVPASFGNANAVIVSDTTKATATWSGSQLTITLIAAASGPVNVDVLASDVVTPDIGYDQDKERIKVYTNLLTTGATFDTGADTTSWGWEVPGGGPTAKMAVGWVSSVNDGAGVAGSGVVTLSATGSTDGIKATNLSSPITYSAGQWYISRMKYFASGAVGGAGVASQAQIWNYSNLIGSLHVDLSANILFGCQTVWSWLESPLYSHAAGSGYPQFQFKPSGAMVANVDEIQIINATPLLVEANPVRACNKLGYASGDFDVAGDTTGWGIEAYSSAFPTKATWQVTNGSLVFTIASGTVNGGKWTASQSGAIYTPAVTVGKGIGIVSDIAATGLTDIAGIFVQYVYGVPTNGAASFLADGQLIGQGEFTGVSSGAQYAVGIAKYPYYQFQFATKGDQSGSVTVNNVDFLKDNSTTASGDATLFP